jgi:hypothetical protein
MTPHPLAVLALPAIFLCSVAGAHGQQVSQKGFAEAQGTFYPQEAPNDATRAVGEFLLRYEVSARPAPWFRLTGSLDARADTHDQTDWDGLDWSDRGVKRPVLGVHRLDAIVSRGPLTLEAGKQFIRWGRADVLNPTDRFAPRDFLSVVDNEVLGVTAARLTAGLQSNSLDLVVSRFTPSRMPLLNQRWAGFSEAASQIEIVDDGADVPDRAQAGARWNHVGRGLEFSLSAFVGNNTLPLLVSEAQEEHAGSLGDVPLPAYRAQVDVLRVYPAIWTAGGDVAVPLHAFTLKGETAFFGTEDDRADQYWLYVVQVERQAGEWIFVGGYAGEVVTTQRFQVGFAPDRGMTRAFLGRASYTIDTNRSAAAEGAIRQDNSGSWLRGEYSQASGQHLRFTVRGVWIRGEQDDFFGRYRKNSNVVLVARYSF